jgi:hypothetical protein
VLIGGGGQDVLDGGPGDNVVITGGLAVISADAALLGQFMASSFVTAGDGQGGTPIEDPASGQHPVLAHPHA